MALNYDAIDLIWSTPGDYIIGPDGDLADTRFDVLLAIAQDLYDRCKSDTGDWQEIPLMGATLSDFAGEPNTAANGRSIRDRLWNALQVYGTISGSDLSIDVFPVAKDKIAIKRSDEGVYPEKSKFLLGRHARHNIAKDESLTWEKVL